jgi:hypothetical protein
MALAQQESGNKAFGAPIVVLMDGDKDSVVEEVCVVLSQVAGMPPSVPGVESRPLLGAGSAAMRPAPPPPRGCRARAPCDC